jgi:hypothetical protein
MAPSLYLWMASFPDEILRPHPFGDVAAILQAGQCWGKGIDVYVPNPCMGGGVFNYSPFMLRLFWLLHLSPGLTLACGVLFCVAYCLALGIFPPARSWAELGLRFIVAASPSAWFALEQANFDVFLFVASSVSVWVLTRSWPIRMSGYGLILFGFLLKFYPAALLPLAARESRGRFVLVTAISLLVMASFYFSFHHTVTSSTILPGISPPFRNTFGATNLPSGLMMLNDLFRGNVNLAVGGHFNLPMPSAMLMHALILCVVLLALLRRQDAEKQLPHLPTTEMLYLLAGALVMAVCFFATQNVSYRAIYLYFLLPGLWRLCPLGGNAKSVLAALLVVSWEAALRVASGAIDHRLHTGITFTVMFWLLRELLWWWLVLQFLRLIFAFVIPNLMRSVRGQD